MFALINESWASERTTFRNSDVHFFRTVKLMQKAISGFVSKTNFIYKISSYTTQNLL